jgi:acyl-CoA thioesterase-2
VERTVSLLDVLRLDPIERDVFRGYSPAEEFSRVRIFGGQVIAQALLAAYGSVEDRICHSVHAYFIRPGDMRMPVLYEVERTREGKSFTTRRVTAVQNGEQIFHLSASFQANETGLAHQFPMPPVPSADALDDETEGRRAAAASLSAEAAQMLMRNRAIEIRRVDKGDWLNPQPAAPALRTWMRAKENLPGDIAIQQAVLAYASDMLLLGTALAPHGLSWLDPQLQMASLDHAIWFHQPTDFSTWHLYDRDSPASIGGRGFNRGLIYSQDGVLAASTCQEGVIRLRTR